MALTVKPNIYPSVPTPSLGKVLITGGCGFLGYHLVARLLSDADCCEHVYIIDRDVSRNIHTHEKATYITASIAEGKDLSVVLDRVRPVTIFHAASPNATYGRRGDYYRTNVVGTQNILALVRERSYVKALVYTSSGDVYATRHHKMLKETDPTWDPNPWPWKGVTEYEWTKALAHRLVLQANTKEGLKTAVIIPAHIYGLRDSQALSLMFDMFEDPRKPVFQVGNGQNMASFVEAGNCAEAHVLAAQALLSGVKGVPGQAFNVSDGEDIPLWWHTRLVCATIRGLGLGKDPISHSKMGVAKVKVRHIPGWAMWLVARVVWWMLLVSTAGYVQPPPALSCNGASWCTEDHTVDIEKVRKVLGYRPEGNRERHEAVVRQAAEWEWERRKSLNRDQNGTNDGERDLKVK
ncbi:hypothetical protein VMCG_10439 [Cytospora schulzeri]|uniref:3-beta hydroxysteroid dehydrogenase/isomerase domain-containing protein n=1 Tax=Cytospora schulzeri TaxID=448051 RepID=A0A423VB15_9PEZI|nr:hypothetical protein VMCG_10439 [Valsa malicola]